jgi:tetratricopeptide (TPR) repeat protein
MRLSLLKNMAFINKSSQQQQRANSSFPREDLEKPLTILQKNLNRAVKYCRNAEKNSFGMSYYQKKLNDDIKNQVVADKRDLSEATHLIRSDEDIQLVLASLLKYQENLDKTNAAQDNMTNNFFNVLYMLKKTKKVLEIYNDRQAVKLFSNYRVFQNLYDYLLAEKCYDELIELFIKQLPRSIRRSKDTKAFFIMESQMELFTRAILLQNTNESLSKLRYVIRFVEDNNGTLSNQTWLRFIYLALAKENGRLALSVLNSKKATFDRGLNMNLKTLAFIQLKQISDAFRMIQIMFNTDVPIFPLVITKLRETTYTMDVKEDLYEVDTLFRKIVIESRMLKMDLSDMAFEKNSFPIEKPTSTTEETDTTEMSAEAEIKSEAQN